MSDRAAAFHPIRRQFGYFVIIGVIGTVLYFGLYNLLRFWSGPLVANGLALTLSMGFSFAAHRRFTFGSPGRPNRSAPMWWQLTTFAIVFGVTLALSSGLLAGMLLVLGSTSRLGENIAIGLAAGSSFLVRFLLLRIWVFRPERRVRSRGERVSRPARAGRPQPAPDARSPDPR